jgi:hypothetical protein
VATDERQAEVTVRQRRLQHEALLGRVAAQVPGLLHRPVVDDDPVPEPLDPGRRQAQALRSARDRGEREVQRVAGGRLRPEERHVLDPSPAKRAL